MRRLPPGAVVTFTKLKRSSQQCIFPENEYGPLKSCIPAIVEDALLCPAFGSLLLLLLVDLGGLRLHFARTSERSVNCA